MRFLLDLFPVFLFFASFKYAEANAGQALEWLQSLGLSDLPSQQAPILLATAVVIMGTLLQIAIVWWRERHIDAMLWTSFILVVGMGSLTLFLHDESFIKWKPTLLYWAMGAGLLIGRLLFGKDVIREMLGQKIELPAAIWRKLTLAWAGFFLSLGAGNLYVAFNFETATWVNFKLFGLTGLMFLFIIAQSVLIAPHLPKDAQDPQA